jgi:hypothetical protein
MRRRWLRLPSRRNGAPDGNAVFPGKNACLTEHKKHYRTLEAVYQGTPRPVFTRHALGSFAASGALGRRCGFRPSGADSSPLSSGGRALPCAQRRGARKRPSRNRGEKGGESGFSATVLEAKTDRVGRGPEPSRWGTPAGVVTAFEGRRQMAGWAASSDRKRHLYSAAGPAVALLVGASSR